MGGINFFRFGSRFSFFPLNPKRIRNADPDLVVQFFAIAVISKSDSRVTKMYLQSRWEICTISYQLKGPHRLVSVEPGSGSALNSHSDLRWDSDPGIINFPKSLHFRTKTRFSPPAPLKVILPTFAKYQLVFIQYGYTLLWPLFSPSLHIWTIFFRFLLNFSF